MMLDESTFLDICKFETIQIAFTLIYGFVSKWESRGFFRDGKLGVGC